MPHQWNHDPTNGGEYKPKVCSGTPTLDPESNLLICVNCGRAELAHNGTPFSDHSQCIMTCELCGGKWQCNKLYPENKECSGTHAELNK